MSLMILKPGMLSTFQDLGRFGHQHLGVSVTGAMDQRAHQLANLLVGNDPGLATLEITLTGPTIRFTKPCCIALCGPTDRALSSQPRLRANGLPFTGPGAFNDNAAANDF